MSSLSISRLLSSTLEHLCISIRRASQPTTDQRKFIQSLLHLHRSPNPHQRILELFLGCWSHFATRERWLWNAWMVSLASVSPASTSTIDSRPPRSRSASSAFDPSLSSPAPPAVRQSSGWSTEDNVSLLRRSPLAVFLVRTRGRLVERRQILLVRALKCKECWTEAQ